MKRQFGDLSKPHIIGGKNYGKGYDKDYGKDFGNGYGVEYGGEYGGKYVSNRRSKRQGYAKSGKRGIFRIIMLAFLVVVLIWAAVIGVVLYAPFSFKLKDADFYMLALERTQSLSEAAQMQGSVTHAGGSGYLVNDGGFLVTAFVYNKKKDAEAVLNRLGEDYQNAEIVSYELKRTKIRRFGDRAAEKSLKQMLDYPLELIDTVIGLVYDLDLYEVSESETILKAEDVKARIEEHLKTSRKIFGEHSKIKAAELTAAFYDNIYENISQATSLQQADKKLTHRLKSYACLTVHTYSVLRKELERVG